MYKEEKDESQTPVAFVIAQLTKDGQGWLTLLVLSQPGYGRVMIELLQQLASTFGVSYITLFALAHVINFYRKLGFINGRGCQEKELPEVTEAANRTKDLKFATTLEAIENTDFNDFLTLLVKHQLTKYPNCKDLWKCQKDGFVMTWCV